MNEIGKFLRKLRIDRDGLSLRDMAKTMGISSSLLSSYETGRRPIADPEEFISAAATALPMSEEEMTALSSIVYRTVDSYKIDLSSIDVRHRDEYVAFARKVPGLSLEDLTRLLSQGSEDDRTKNNS